VNIRVLIDDARARPARASLYEQPLRVIRADGADEVPCALAELQTALDRGSCLAGFFSYELGYALEPRLAGLMPDERNVPLLWFGVFDGARSLDAAQIDAWVSETAQDQYTLSKPDLTMDAEDYSRRFRKVKDYISAGDIYQLNLTLKGRSRFEGDPLALYRDLRRKQPVPYAAFVDTGDFTVISASPELFLSIAGDRVVGRPMKGTAARALTPTRDRETAAWLSQDLKSRAENLMIVDLMRNDLGRVAEIGSVRVSDLFTVETYETLHQMTSGVEARLKPETGISEVLESAFPPGSVIGAPKVRAMEIIRELESEARGIYTGAIGAFSPDGKVTLNVAIRTLTLDAGGALEVGIGSGVVHDSEARAEYEECLLKMRFLTEPVREFQLIETMLHEPDRGYALPDRHLQRLGDSAEYFRFRFSSSDIETVLADFAASLEMAPYRVRLLLYRDGRTEISGTKLPADTPVTQMAYVVSDHRIDSGDVFLYHKTTERTLYDTEWASMHEAYGADEVIFFNERGELAEGSRTNIFVRQDGKLLTPALSCGLLPGTLREELLVRGDAEEAVLLLDDLARADAVYLGNSVRGLVPASEIAAEILHTATS
jgi:para-aminobenzoate synthetase/4-amino-4-deoxychorismate lyase